MPEFIDTLESRRLLSAVTLAAAEAKLASDVSILATDARSAKVALVADVKVFKADLTALDLKSGALKSGLQNAVASGRTKIEADVSHIISAGYKDGMDVVSDVLHITLFDAGDATKIAAEQKRLGADIKALQTLETPLVNKLSADVGNAVTQVNSAVQAIIAANPADTTLQSDWTQLSSAFKSAENTLVPDLGNIITDLDALSTAT